MQARPARHAFLLPGAEKLAYLDVDPSPKRIYGPGQAGPGLTTARSKQVLARAQPADRGDVPAAQISVARADGCTGEIIIRAGSGCYTGAVVNATYYKPKTGSGQWSRETVTHIKELSAAEIDAASAFAPGVKSELWAGWSAVERLRRFGGGFAIKAVCEFGLRGWDARPAG